MGIPIRGSSVLCFLLLISFVLPFTFIQEDQIQILPERPENQLKAVLPYNESKSKDYAYLSMITHCTDSQIQNWNCKLCKNVTLTDVALIQNSTYDIAGYAGYSKSYNQIIISWRGSVDTKNWEVDFRYKQTKYTPRNATCTGCSIHTGIYQAYRSVQQQVDKSVKTLLAKYPTATITSTGHSLGGGLSLLTALELSIEYAQKVSFTYNFGCLRIGNAALVSFLKGRVPSIYRVVHNKDPVPHLPPNDFGYIHPANQILYDQEMKNYTVCNESGQDKNCSNKFVPYLDPKDHTFYFVATDSSVC